MHGSSQTACAFVLQAGLHAGATCSPHPARVTIDTAPIFCWKIKFNRCPSLQCLVDLYGIIIVQIRLSRSIQLLRSSGPRGCDHQKGITKSNRTRPDRRSNHVSRFSFYVCGTSLSTMHDCTLTILTHPLLFLQL